MAQNVPQLSDDADSRAVASSDRHPDAYECNRVHYMIIINAMEAGGRSEVGPWPGVSCVLAFDVMCCVWGK